MKPVTTAFFAVALISSAAMAAPELTAEMQPEIMHVTPPEKGFFSKELWFHGIPIKAQ